MIELYRWLGDLNGINTLGLFGIDPHNYFPRGSTRELETQRIERDLKTNYRKLQLKLHPDQQQQFPESFKQLSGEYFNEVKNLYDLLTDKEKYKNPNPNEGNHHLPGYITTTLETFTLTSYVLSLQHNQPDELPLVSTIKKFILARNELEQMLTQKAPYLAPLPPRDILPPTEYIQMIEERDRLLQTKEQQLQKLTEERDRQRQLTEGYRTQLHQAVEDRHTTENVLSEIEQELQQVLQQE